MGTNEGNRTWTYLNILEHGPRNDSLLLEPLLNPWKHQKLGLLWFGHTQPVDEFCHSAIYVPLIKFHRKQPSIWCPQKPTDLPGFWSWILLDFTIDPIFFATWSHLGLQESIILSMKDLIAAPCCGEPFRPWGARNSRRRDRDVLHKAVRWRWYSQDHLRGYPWYLWWWWWWWWLSMVII